VHPVLLKGEGLTINRPSRAVGTLIGAGASFLALSLAAALLLKATGWPVSFTQFLGYAAAGVLAVLALIFAFWAYGCHTLRYVIDRTGITIGWGPIQHFISIETIQKIVPGRGEHQPHVQGLGWWGYHIGLGQVDGIGQVLFYSTHRAPEELVYIQTAGATFAISPANPIRFLTEAQRFQQAGKPARRSGVKRDILSGHPIWADRLAQLLAASAVAANLALWGFLFAIYPGLSNEITIEFPPIGDIVTLHEKAEIMKIPGTATAVLGLNLLAGLTFQWKERAAAYLLVSNAVFFQLLFWIAAAFAVINA